jgi:hypothetical protein
MLRRRNGDRMEGLGRMGLKELLELYIRLWSIDFEKERLILTTILED